MYKKIHKNTRNRPVYTEKIDAMAQLILKSIYSCKYLFKHDPPLKSMLFSGLHVHFSG